MSTIRHGLQQLCCLRQVSKLQLAATRRQTVTSVSSSTKRHFVTNPNETRAVEAEAPPTGIIAAPEKPFVGINHARAVPVSPSYFARESQFNDAYVQLSTLLQRYERLPVASPEEVPRQLWKTLDGYRSYTGEPVKALQYSRALTMVKRLHQIHPQLMPGEVKEALVGFKRAIDPFSNVAKPIPIDRFGRALGVGRRKTSTARAWVVEGTGEVQVNGKPLNDIFGRVHDRESAIWALRSTDRMDKYNVWALVEGGGTTGQAEALTLAIAKALLAHEPALKPMLRQCKWPCWILGLRFLSAKLIANTNCHPAAGCITRDARTVERKKHGHVKARKMPAWVKR